MMSKKRYTTRQAREDLKDVVFFLAHSVAHQNEDHRRTALNKAAEIAENVKNGNFTDAAWNCHHDAQTLIRIFDGGE